MYVYLSVDERHAHKALGYHNVCMYVCMYVYLSVDERHAHKALGYHKDGKLGSTPV
jgi:hypothetical protein